MKSKDTKFGETPKLEDYAHFYIGQQVVTPNCEGHSQKLQAVSLTDAGLMLSTTEDPYFFNENQCELVLRPLNDITREEFDIVFTAGGDRGYDTIKTHGLSSYMSGNIQSVAVQIGLLLSMGFDLFGLIPTGLAISSLTANTPSND